MLEVHNIFFNFVYSEPKILKKLLIFFLLFLTNHSPLFYRHTKNSKTAPFFPNNHLSGIEPESQFYPFVEISKAQTNQYARIRSPPTPKL